MDQSQIADIIEIEQLLARYAIGMTRDDIEAVIEVFTPDGSYSAFGDTLRAVRLPGAGPARRRRACSSRARPCSSSTGTPARASSRCASSTRRPTTCASASTPTRTAAPPSGWRLHTRAMTFLRRSGARDAGKAHDPTRPVPSAGAGD